jgi:glycerol-3-phosphate acyltransferase PlsY
MRDIIVIILSYLMGCFSTGYYYIRIFHKQDIRDIGSNVTGATNVSRLAGKKGFALTLAGDCLKGIAVVLLCRYLRIGDTTTLICMFAVIIGHIFPFQLQFKGGKGLSTALGVLLIYNPITLIYIFVIFCIMFIFIKDRNIDILGALLLLPMVLIMADYTREYILLFIALDLVFLYAFRDNIRRFMKKRRQGI